MHKCGGVQEEDYKFNSIVILDSGKLGWFFIPISQICLMHLCK